MKTEEIDREVRSFLVTHFLSGRADRLREDGLLLGDIVDSAGVIELVMYLQNRFSITVEDDEVIPDNLDSVKSLVAFVARKTEERAAAPDARS